VALSLPLMVRIRKNANLLSEGERERFLAAFAKLNDAGLGPFVNFRNMHTSAGDPEAHRAAGFLPWHRAYLLDLERELQVIDPSVALPYWRFDQPAPLLFDLDFIGVSDDSGSVHFSQDNPLQFWVTDGMPGIQRRPRFNTSTEAAHVSAEADTLSLGSPDNVYAAFRRMEGDPHGAAHTSFGGSISSISTAARDPLFFLLHCNVDRLWAKWQWFFRRWDADQPEAYDPRPQRVGHNLPDSMWPWNGVTTPPRPSTAPGGGLASSPTAAAPGRKPRVRDLLDLQGQVSAAGRLGFDYDDVPFE
jgi:tyrosinase